MKDEVKEKKIVETRTSDVDVLPEIHESELENMLREVEGDERRRTSWWKRIPRGRARMLLLGAVVVIIALAFAVRYVVYANAHESTDDAFIEAHVVQISPKVSGHILHVYIEDNQEVKKGDLLAEIDSRDYEANVQQARAKLEASYSKQQAANIDVGLTDTTSSASVRQSSSTVALAKANVEGARAQVEAARGRVDQASAQVQSAQANLEQSKAQVESAQAEATRTNTDQQRYQKLYATDAVSRQQLDYAVAAARSANAALEAAKTKVTAAEAQIVEARAAESAARATLQQSQSQVGSAEAQVGEAAGKLAAANAAPKLVAQSKAQVSTANADIDQAKAELQQAELNLSYTKIYAPEDGRLTRKAIEEGTFVSVGQALMAIVPEEVWVVANFKETQLTSMKPGQSAEVRVDAYPDKVFHGHVDSIQSGTGARFSILPPENATGNYVKVVQRVPVKIVLDEQPDPEHVLGPGMSVVPYVTVK